MKRFAIFGISLLLLMMCACARDTAQKKTVSISPQFRAESVDNPPETVTVAEEIPTAADETIAQVDDRETDVLSTKQIAISNGIFDFSINDCYDSLYENVDAVRRYRNYGMMVIDCDELKADGNLGITIYDKNLSTCGIIEFYNGDTPVTDGESTDITKVLALLWEDDSDSLNTALMSIMVTFDSQVKNDADMAFLLAEMATAEETTGSSLITRNGISYELNSIPGYWYLYITQGANTENDNPVVNELESEDNVHITGGGTFTTYSFGENGTVTKTTGTDTVTMGERNALSMAKEYLSSIPFSYSGLVEQLEFEGFSHDEAVYGVDNCGADWNEQAAKMASDYLDSMAFSRSGLIEQLQFEGFSYDQAVYGVEANGY